MLCSDALENSYGDPPEIGLVNPDGVTRTVNPGGGGRLLELTLGPTTPSTSETAIINGKPVTRPANSE